MLNILILAAGQLKKRDGQIYSSLMFEEDGKLFVEKIITKCSHLGDKKFIFVISRQQCTDFHLNKIIKILEPSASIVILENQASGAACSALLAVDEMVLDQPLLILNSNEELLINFNDPLEVFLKKDITAGIIKFRSVNPIYSYALIDQENIVQGVSEKNPISANAIAGFFWFLSANHFIEAVKLMILKNDSHNSLFFISLCLNQIILSGEKIYAHVIDPEDYRPLKNLQHIEAKQRT